MLKIETNSKVVMHFSLKLEDGTVVDSTHYHAGKPAKFHMGDGCLTQHFEQCLLGLRQGNSATFTLEAKEAFGFVDPDKIQHMDNHLFVGDLVAKKGAVMAFTDPSGQQLPGVITDVTQGSVTVDFNHPLAGQRIIFDVEIISVS